MSASVLTSLATIYATTTARDRLVQLSLCTTDPDTILLVATAITVATSSNHTAENSTLYVTEGVRDALVALSMHATTAESAQAVLVAFCQLTLSCANSVAEKLLFGTVSVRDAIVKLTHGAATTAGVLQCVSSTILNIVVDDGTKDLYRTPEVRDAWILLASAATTSDYVRLVASILSSIVSTSDTAKKAVFTTSHVRDKLIAMSLRDLDSDAARAVSMALCHLVGSNLNAELFRTPNVRDAIVSLSASATTCESVIGLSLALISVVDGSDEGTKALFATSAARSMLTDLASHATTPLAVTTLARAIRILIA
ncbi:Hypothetical protein, putative, partial [Bodo saltans]